MANTGYEDYQRTNFVSGKSFLNINRVLTAVVTTPITPCISWSYLRVYMAGFLANDNYQIKFDFYEDIAGTMPTAGSYSVSIAPAGSLTVPVLVAGAFLKITVTPIAKNDINPVQITVYGMNGYATSYDLNLGTVLDNGSFALAAGASNTHVQANQYMGKVSLYVAGSVSNKWTAELKYLQSFPSSFTRQALFSGIEVGQHLNTQITMSPLPYQWIFKNTDTVAQNVEFSVVPSL